MPAEKAFELVDLIKDTVVYCRKVWADHGPRLAAMFRRSVSRIQENSFPLYISDPSIRF